MDMKILAHRGYWKNRGDENSIVALKRALDAGFGIESDVRDFRGKLVISHEVASESAPSLEIVMKLLQEDTGEKMFAINIKSDGIEDMLRGMLERYGIQHYFTFDMSIPQMVSYRERGLRYFTRQSEYEKGPCLYETATGVWMDAFQDDSWLAGESIRKHLSNGKKVAIVSPELHHREESCFWKRMKEEGLQSLPGVFLCTDKPEKARTFFEI